MKDVMKIHRCLKDANKKDADVLFRCRLVATIAMAMFVHAEKTEPVVVNLVDSSSGFSVCILLDEIHEHWTKKLQDDVVNLEPKLAPLFDGRGTSYPIPSKKQTITKQKQTKMHVHVVFRRLMTHTCTVCLEEFGSAVNCARCEASHSNRKRVTEPVQVDAAGFTSFWDCMETGSRRLIASHIMPFLKGVSTSFAIPPAVMPLVELARGTVDVAGHVLAAALDEASENTFLLRMSQEISCPSLHDARDHIAAMADVCANLIVAERAHALAAALMDEPPAPKKLTKAQLKKQAQLKKKDEQEARWRGREALKARQALEAEQALETRRANEAQEAQARKELEAQQRALEARRELEAQRQAFEALEAQRRAFESFESFTLKAPADSPSIEELVWKMPAIPCWADAV